MAQTGYTPLLIYGSTITGNVPLAANLTTSSAGVELAINAFDGKLFYKDASGNVQVLAGKGGTGVVAGSNTQVQFNNNGVFGAAAGLTWDGTYLTANSIKDSALTSGRVTYAGTSGLLQDSANLTFDGTTLTANALAITNGVTLSGGAANGVAYLNGSKVLTTGSALTFDGTILSNETGSGVFSSRDNFNLKAYAGSTNGTVVDINSAGTVGVTKFSINNFEQMRLTSTGLGIGTSSPAQKLDVYGNGMKVNNASYVGYLGADSVFGSSGVASSFTVRSDNALTFSTGGPYTRATIDSSGNLGLGVTPSAWGASYRAFEFGGGGSALFSGTSTAAQTYLTSNAYFNGSNWAYKNTNAASNYEQLSGAHAWYTAPSGTAGNAISFTQAMTLDASGNLLVGTTSSYFGAAGRGTIELNGSSDSIFGMKAGGTVYGYLYSSASEFRVGNITANPLTFYTNNTERARIDSSGNLLVGTTAPIAAPNSNTVSVDSSSVYHYMLRNSAAASGKFWRLCADTANTFYILNQSPTGVSIADGATSWSSVSDERSKTSVTPFENAAAKVLSLRAGTGRYLTDDEGVSRSFLIAQDVQAVLPEAVDVGGDEQGTLSLRYTDTIPLLVAAIQEQQAQIAQLTQRLAAAGIA